MQVTQLINAKGNPVKNQFVITNNAGQFFKSYDSLIAFKPRNGDTPVLTNAWDYSATTLKHLKTFLGPDAGSKKDIEKKIESGAYILDDSLEIVN